MNPSDLKIRFDELCAGRALSDLSLEEERELAALAAQLGVDPDAAFELMASSLEVDSISDSPLPAHLASRLHAWADETVASSATNIVRPPQSVWKRAIAHPVSGWAAAAVILMVSLYTSRMETPLPLTQAEQRLRAEAADLVERKFQGLGDFKQAGGSVVWSDTRQEGYMTLSGIPSNDPKKAQYQLWIVDPTRDADAPVDGGVFDVPADGSPVIVPIAAKLSIHNPQAFVITLEQPGGVVKSKQEKVVALAKS
jgi:anti-sigma-K factor RskA